MKKQNKKKSKRGFTLVELLVGVFLFTLLFLGIYGTYSLGIKVTNHDRMITEGTSIAEEQIEAIHAMTYDNIGISGGIPSGTLLATETETRDHGVYTIKKTVKCIDDPYNNLAPVDTSPCNYKQIEVKVSWPSGFKSNTVVLDTIIAPPQVETEVNMGVLMVNISNSQGLPISNAEVHIKNTALSPQIDFTTETDANGGLTLPGAKPATTSYEITATKSGYESVQTYAPYPSSPFNPNDVNLSVAKGSITSKSFVIDMISSLTINLRDTLGNGIPNTPFALKGGRVIGTTVEPSPKQVYYYDQAVLTTNTSGNWTKSDLGKGPYYFTITNPNYELITTSPTLPWALAPNGNQTVTVIMGDKTANLLVFTVKEQDSTAVLPGATVQILDQSNNVIQTATTDDNGIAYFPQIATPAVTITAGTTYSYSITKTGYTASSGTSLVNGITRVNVSLVKTP